MVKKQLAFSAVSVLTIVFLAVAVSAVVLVAALWADGSTTMTVVKGDNATFTVDIGSFTPPISYTISLYDDNYNLIKHLSSVSVYASEHAQETILITSNDYGGLGGTYHIVISASDVYDSAYNNQLTLVVTQSAPVVSGLPDVDMEESESKMVFDLDDYVTDADDNDAALTWSVSGNDNLTVAIDSNKRVTLTALPNFVGQNVLTFTATDPSGDTGSQSIRVNVVAKGELLVSKKVTLHKVEIEFYGDDLLKIRNTGSSIDDVNMEVNIESADVEVHHFRFDLDRNRVMYRSLELENLNPGVYLARIKLDSVDDDDFEKTGYLLIEKF